MNIRVYRKKDGNLMLFVNGSNGVSVGISDRVYTSKFTKGQEKVWGEFWDFIRTTEDFIPFTGDFSKHNEDKAVLDFDLKLMITDVCNVGGQHVESDGGYLLYNDKLLKL